MIELRDLEKSYGSRRILSGASLTVNGGESVALVGANGTGKTTTLRCALGLAHLDKGRISVDGIDSNAHPRQARTRLSYMAQRTNFPATLTVREILTVVADLRAAPSRAIEREISLCGLHTFAERTVGELSGGERQRVAVAALLIPEASTYLLDEPLLNLDPFGARLLVERLRALRDEGRAVLFTTHVSGDIDMLATRVVVLRDGRFVPIVDEAGGRDRHVSIGVEGAVERWVETALRAGATHAWPRPGRLHALVTDSALSGLLAQLEGDGAHVGTFRTESALALALEQLGDEVGANENQSLVHVDRRPAPRELRWRAWWSGTDTARSR